MKKIGLFASIVLISALVNCSRDMVPCTRAVKQSVIDAVPKTQLATDVQRIKTYLTNNTLVAVEDPSGLHYTITTTGTGLTPCLEGTISVTYNGQVLIAGTGSNAGTLNPTPFDTSTAPVSFPLNQLILGWQIGFLTFPAGTVATLYVPSGLAYGANSQAARPGFSSIPPNSVLVFTVELVAIQ